MAMKSLVGFSLKTVNTPSRSHRNASRLAAASRPLDKPDEIFLKPTVEALTLLLENMKQGRVSLMPYLL